MEQQPQTTISSSTLLTALAGILFFGPLITKTNTNDNPFILGYCKIGTLNLILFILSLSIFILEYHFPSTLLQRLFTLTASAICTISAFSIFACLNEVPLLVENEPLTHDIQHKATILKSFIPLYNIKLRYQTPNFQSPYRRLKESILWRTIFSFFTLFFGSKMGSIIIAFLFIRLFLVLINIDIVPNNLKKLINHGFLIHPEEIIGYFRFPLPKKLRPAALKNISSEELKTTLITQAKQQYADMAGSNINHLLQYLTFGILIRQLFSTTSLTYELLLPTLAISLLVARALLTYHTYKKLPNIPLLHEVRSLIIK